MATSKSHFWLNQSTELVNIWICQQYWELIEAPKRIFPSTYFLGHFFTLKTIKIGDKSDLDVVILNVKWFNEPHYAPLVPPHLQQHLDTPGSPSDWRTSSPTGRSNLRQLSPALHRYLHTWACSSYSATNGNVPMSGDSTPPTLLRSEEGHFDQKEKRRRSQVVLVK